ncbi:MAG TPA: hypothetical protein VHQ43_03385 [Solirubrobacterales bacterium]|jgi:hypothetical protein|nr:hypothetical protein [Solirubrobacterales bacterium]
MSFAVSISILSLLQAGLVALPRAWRFAWLDRFRSPWWALVPALSIVVVIGVVALEGESATALSWLALVAVPPFAALALGWLVRGARPEWAAAAIPLFVLAWASPGSLLGEAAATALTALGCIGLGWLLVAVAPAPWLRLGIYAMAAVDTWFVATELLQAPNAVLSAAAPAGLPRLQAVHFGSALMGFGDLFVAALLGCLLAGSSRLQLRAAALVAVLALSFDLLFLAVDTLPATVPVALALVLVDVGERRAGRRSDAGGAGDREDQVKAGGASQE